MTTKATAVEAVEAIQKALAKKPTAGNWKARKGFMDCMEVFPSDVKIAKPYRASAIVDIQEGYKEWRANAAHIAACNPDNIRTVLASLAAKEAEVVVLREALEKVRPAFLFCLASLLADLHDEADKGNKTNWQTWINSEVESLPEGLAPAQAIDEAIAALNQGAQS